MCRQGQVMDRSGMTGGPMGNGMTVLKGHEVSVAQR